MLKIAKSLVMAHLYYPLINTNAKVNVLSVLNFGTSLNCNCSSKLKYRQTKKCLALNLSSVEFIMLTNVKMPTSVGILTFMRRIMFRAQLS